MSKNKAFEHAMFLQALGENDRADVEFIKAVEQEANDPSVIHSYAIFLHTTGMDCEKAEKYYKEALRLDPNCAVKNCNYAMLMFDVKKDYKTAEKHLKKVIEIDDDYAPALGTYALLLDFIKKEYDEAERYYQKSIRLDNEDCVTIGNYAIFLKNVKKDYGAAEHYFKKALDLEPMSIYDNCGYAGLLYGMGKKEEGDKYLKRAMSVTEDVTDEVAVEMWFYVLAHFDKTPDRAQATLDGLLASGARSVRCDFEPNIKMAEKDGYPDTKMLREYSEKITTE